jgi:lipopolysaccharide assembly outer membrane protein LptD (OstA)
MLKPKYFTCLFLLVLFPFLAFAQTVDKLTEEEEKRVQEELDKKEKSFKEMLQKTEKIQVNSLKQSYSDNGEICEFEGAVEAIWGDAHLYADKVTLNKAENSILAEGNVKIEAGKDVISGSKFEGDLSTGYGTFYDVKGYIDPLYYFEGKKAERFKEDKYRLYDGYFTSCTGDVPAWNFKLKKATIHLDNYVYLINPIIFVRKVPIFYFPFWVYPIKPERSTGLLVPKWGYNSRDGLYYKQGFFWAIRDNMDLKLGLDWASKSGWGYNTLLRYVFSKTCGGNMGYEYKKDYLISNELNAYQNSSILPSFTLNNDYTERWFGHWLHLQTYPYDIKNIININYVSDRRYFKDLRNDLDQQNEQISSDLSFTKNWSSYSLNLFARYTEDLGNSENDTFQAYQTIPELKFSSLSKNIFGLPTRYEYDLDYSHIQLQSKGSRSFGSDLTLNELKTTTDKYALNISLSYPWMALPWLSLTPKITLNETWYLNSKGKLFFTMGDGKKDMIFGDYYSLTNELTGTNPDEFFPKERWPEQVVLDGNNLRRDIYTANLSIIGPQFYRIFDMKGLLNMEKMNHMIEPKFDFNYIPDVCYGYGDEFGEKNSQRNYMILGDVVAPMNSVTYSVDNKFFGSIKKDDGTSEKNEIGYINFSQRYDFRQKNRVDKLDELYKDSEDFFVKRTENPFSNIRTQMKFQPVKPFYVAVDFDYDPFLYDFPRWQVDLVKEGEIFYSRISWSYYESYQRIKDLAYDENEKESDYGYKESQNFLSTNLGISILDKKWVFDILSRYNISNTIFPENILRVVYNSQCWSLQVRYLHHQLFEARLIDNELASNRKNDYDIEMIIVLRNVGPIELM